MRNWPCGFWSLRVFSLAIYHVTQGQGLTVVMVGGRPLGSPQEERKLCLPVGRCVQITDGHFRVRDAVRSPERILQPSTGRGKAPM